MRYFERGKKLVALKAFPVLASHYLSALSDTAEFVSYYLIAMTLMWKGLLGVQLYLLCTDAIKK